MSTAGKRMYGQLGDTIPVGDIHGVSVYIPTWESTVSWCSRDPVFLTVMKTGYPRFFYHKLVTRLNEEVRAILDRCGYSRLLEPISSPAYSVMLFSCARSAVDFQGYLQKSKPNTGIELFVLSLAPSRSWSAPHGEGDVPNFASDFGTRQDWESLELFAGVYPDTTECQALAKQFWQHTGFGISSRYAELCLEHLQSFNVQRLISSSRPGPNESNGHGIKTEGLSQGAVTRVQKQADLQILDETVQRVQGEKSKATLRKRLASLYSGAVAVEDNDVLLFATGMSAITEVSASMKEVLPGNPVVVYGFLYVDTFKTISRIHGWETILKGHSSAADIDELEDYLASGKRISGLVLEVPGNPLLRSPDLRRLRKLADRHHFPIIIDDTVGTAVNVDTLPYADVIAHSLTKMFSGACNVMGGSLILNPQSPFYTTLGSSLKARFIDVYFPPDAVQMDINSRDFAQRVRAASANADMVASMLAAHPIVTEVFYPRGSDTQHLYDSYMASGSGGSRAGAVQGEGAPAGQSGYGYLLSANFRHPKQAVAFFDGLETAKGPSLGTNFTLSCPYTLYAHYNEMDWAAQYGVGEFLVRISTGLEEPAHLRAVVEAALAAAEKVSI